MRWNREVMMELEEAVFSRLASAPAHDWYCNIRFSRCRYEVCVSMILGRLGEWPNVSADTYLPVRSVIRKKNVQAAAQMIAARVLPELRRKIMLQTIGEL